MKNTISLTLGSIAVLAFAVAAHAQDAPYAVGPVHPMSAPLPKDSRFAKVPPQLQNVQPIRPKALNLPVKENEAIGYDALSGRTLTAPASNMILPEGTACPGSAGSIDLFSKEPFINRGNRDSFTVIGADNRTTIGNASAYPWRANAEILITFKDGAQAQGSCTLISGKYALTAGHCVFDSRHGGWAKSIQVWAGRSGSYLPYGSAWATYMRTYTGWTVSGNNQYDMALITLDRNLGSTVGWFGYGYWSNLNGVVGNLSAYDADVNPNYQKYRADTIYPDTNVMYYYFDTYPGSSGGGVYRIIGNDRYVMGDNNWQYSNVNMGVRITSGRFSDLQNWINSGF